MAKRGGRGGTQDFFRSQLGSFLKTTLQQLDTVREVVVQKSKAGRIQIDLTLLKRKRKDVLAQLGAVVQELAQAGRLDEVEFPEISDALANLESVDERIEHEERRARAAAAGLPFDESGFHEGDGEGEEDEGARDVEDADRAGPHGPRATRAGARAADDDDFEAEPALGDDESDEDDAADVEEYTRPGKAHAATRPRPAAATGSGSRSAATGPTAAGEISDDDDPPADSDEEDAEEDADAEDVDEPAPGRRR